MSSPTKKPGAASFALKSPSLSERLIGAEHELLDAANDFTHGKVDKARLRACAIDFARLADEVDELDGVGS